jgi:hypothetical protein
MQDHSTHGDIHHRVVQEGLDCEIFTDLIYFTLKF